MSWKRLTAVALGCLLFGSPPAALSAGTELKSDQAGQTFWTEGEHAFRYRAVAGAEMKVTGKDRLDISSGKLLLETTGPCVVTTPISEIFIKRNALVLIRAEQNAARCLVLWDNDLGAVTVVCQKRHARLGPGEEAFVTDHDPKGSEIMADEIGRRRIKVHVLGSGKAMTTSEFSLLQALERDPLLYEMFRSPDDRDRILKEKIIKIAAVLNMVTGRRGYYTTGTRF